MIKVTFTDEIEIITSTEHLYQWDVGQVLEIDGLNVGTPTIHFGVKGDATGYAVQSQIVDGKLRCGIPDTVLQSGKQIIVYIYVSAGASKYTDRVILIPVIERNKPSNYKTVNMDEVTETQSFFDSMVDRLTSLEKRVPISFWVGTQAEYNKIEQKQNNCLYIITDDIIVDYIVKQGIDTFEDITMHYEMWNSGTTKIWCRCNTLFANENITMRGIDYPEGVVFKSNPCGFISILDGFNNQGEWLQINAKIEVLQTRAIAFVQSPHGGMTFTEDTKIPVSMFIIGQWK